MAPHIPGAAILGLILCSCCLKSCLASPWRCDVPSKPNKVVDPSLVLGWDGTNPYCLSLDGKRCWSAPRSSCQMKVQHQQQQQLAASSAAGQKPLQQLGKPLVCGKALKAATGVSGYEDAGHWCSIARAYLDQPAKDCLKQGKGMFSYAKKVCVSGKPGGAACSKHTDCASDSCIFSCGFKGRCAYCKQDADCPQGSKCWVTTADANDGWANTLPMCGLTCNPQLGHVCACGESTARGTPRPCPDDYYCSAPSYGDGCGRVPETSSMTKCLEKTRNRFASNCEDTEGNVEPDPACDGPSGQQGVCLQSPDKRGLMWAERDYNSVYRRCTHRCSSNADCPKSAAAPDWRATDYAQLELCDTLKLTHTAFPTCLVGLRDQTPALHEICSVRGVLPCKEWKVASLTAGVTPKGSLPTVCAVPERLLLQQGAAVERGGRLKYGKCAALCPGLSLGASCRALLPGTEDLSYADSAGEYLAKLVCRQVRVVSKDSAAARTVKACVDE